MKTSSAACLRPVTGCTLSGAECLHLLLQKQQALLGQMLMEGYGCERDAAAGKEWSDKARRRGYRMAGVYCEL